MKYEAMPVIETKGEEPTGGLRWHLTENGLVLQQTWAITTYQSGYPVRVERVWRDVPTAT